MSDFGLGEVVPCAICGLPVRDDAVLNWLELAVAGEIGPRHLPGEDEPPRHLLCHPSAGD